MAELEKTTQAHRFGAWAGLWWRRWRALEDRQLERAQASNMRHGRVLLRCVFRLGDLFLLGTLLLAIYWMLLPVLLVIGLVYGLIHGTEIGLKPRQPTIDEIDHPAHRLYWPELHDE